MFEKFVKIQRKLYLESRDFFCTNNNKLILLEEYISKIFSHFIDTKIQEIKDDYNEASYLYPFWKNYPPDDRGRSPRGDQFPWIEVGEHTVGDKLSKFISTCFDSVRNVGLPAGPDERLIVSSHKIREILEITDTCWIFCDIKSAGPRDDAHHAVMSHNQISGSGEWDTSTNGIKNQILTASGTRSSHPFHCSIPPIYILSNGTIAPVVHVIIKPVYKMLSTETKGQPLSRIDTISTPNGILLTISPGYLKKYPGLIYPGKDDKYKNPLKLRCRISFDILSKLQPWRYKSKKV